MKSPNFVLRMLFSAFFVLLSALCSYAGTHNPNILSIPAYEYKAGKKNWGFAFDSRGLIYVANNDGLLRYDGLQWHFIDSGSIIRSIAVDKDDRVFTGGYKEFGYWEKDNRGILNYTSLSESVIGSMDPDEEIWRIIVRKEGVYFQSFSHIYFYDYNHVTTLPSVGFILLLQEVNDQLLIDSFGKIYEVNKSSIRPLFDVPASLIHVILPSDKGLLLCSAKDGIWLEKDGVVTAWNESLNKELKNAGINCGLTLPNGHYMIGTLSKGIYELDAEGRIVRHYTIQSGLQSNTILSILLDANDNVWVGTDNGISKFEYDSRLHFIRDNKGELGSVHATAVSDDKLYIGTNKGLFSLPYSSLSLQNSLDNLQPVAGSSGQVWKLLKTKSNLYMGHHKGLFEVTGSQLIPVYTRNGVQSLKEFTVDNMSCLVASSYNKLILFVRNDETDKYEFLRELKGNVNVSTSMEFDHQGNLWLGHEYKGMSCYRFNKAMDEVSSVPADFDPDFKLSQSFVKVSLLNGRVILLSNGIGYTYDDLNQKIVPFEPLSKSNKLISFPKLIQSIDNHRYWLIGKNEWSLLEAGNNRLSVLDRLHFNDPSIESVDGYETVYAINDSTSIISLMNGILIYNQNRESKAGYLNNKLSLSFIQVYNADGICDTLDLLSEKKVILPFNHNNLRFRISGCGLQNMHNSYQYMLKGMTHNWSDIQKSGEISFERLPFGKYTLLIRSLNNKDNTGQIENADIAYRFEILPPWYFRWYFILFYVLSISVIIFTVRKYYAIKHKKQLVRQAELEEQMRIIQEKQELESVLHQKNSKLVEITSTTIKKNELLHNVKEEIEAFVSRNPSASISNRLSKISRTINAPALVKDDWSLFVMQFESAHPDFFRDIKTAYPALTPSELKLAACLKLNLTTKDIAALLNISVRGVEVSRYRLRKKINLSSAENLNEFFIRNF
ncbi:MAG: triple tyrosine motif-containing protein [Bacteroidales bacterium]